MTSKQVITGVVGVTRFLSLLTVGFLVLWVVLGPLVDFAVSDHGTLVRLFDQLGYRVAFMLGWIIAFPIGFAVAFLSTLHGWFIVILSSICVLLARRVRKARIGGVR